MTVKTPGKLVSARDYHAAYDPLTGFEGICTLARQRRNLAFLQEVQPAHVLEVGCGALLLSRMAREAGLATPRWTIVEPVAEFAQAARAFAQIDGGIEVIEGYLETSAKGLRAARPQGHDSVVLSGLLHETSDPLALLAAAVELAAPGAQVLASVPNARSFHRLLAVAAGLIPTPDTLTDRNHALGQPVVFDARGLSELMTRAGLTDLACDGYLFKPFTHAQMDLVLADAPSGSRAALVEGLIRLGADFPDQAAEICVIGRKPLR